MHNVDTQKLTFSPYIKITFSLKNPHLFLVLHVFVCPDKGKIK